VETITNRKKNRIRHIAKVTGRRRRHSRKLFKNRVRLDIAKYSFGNWVCDQWNKFPAAIVSSQGINTFKSMLEKYLRNMGGFK